MDSSILLEDRHAQTIIYEILKFGGEARYSQLRALAVEKKQMPNATLHKRLKALVDCGILETPQPKNGKKVAARTYRLSESILRDLEPCYSHFHRQVQEAVKNVEEKGCLEEEFSRLQHEAYEAAQFLLFSFLAASFRNPELLKNGIPSMLLVLKAMMMDLHTFITLFAEKQQLKITWKKWSLADLEPWQKQLVKNLGLA
jgi:DNA-binding HxlR family transcriptional regulator